MITLCNVSKRQFNSMEIKPLIIITKLWLYTITNNTISHSSNTIKLYRWILMTREPSLTEVILILLYKKSNKLIKISTWPLKSCLPMPNFIILKVSPIKIQKIMIRPLKCSKKLYKSLMITFQVFIILV